MAVWRGFVAVNVNTQDVVGAAETMAGPGRTVFEVPLIVQATVWRQAEDEFQRHDRVLAELTDPSIAQPLASQQRHAFGGRRALQCQVQPRPRRINAQ